MPEPTDGLPLAPPLDDPGPDGPVATVETRVALFRVLDYVSKWATAEILNGLLQNPAMCEALRRGVTPEECARGSNLTPRQARSLLETLRVEEIVDVSGRWYRLTGLGCSVLELRGWLELFLAGYGRLYHHSGELWRGQVRPGWRDMRAVGLASARISEYDALPLVMRLVEELGRPDAVVADFGCANAMYLVRLCELLPGIRGIGIEPDPDLAAEARRLVTSRGLDGRIRIANARAQDLDPEDRVDFVVFGFVLQELSEQIGIPALVNLLRSMGERHPKAWILAIEVDAAGRQDVDAMRTDPHRRGYYNHYYLLHDFTNQRLLPFDRWRSLFREAGFEVCRELATDPAVDATGLTVAFALRFTGAGLDAVSGEVGRPS